MSRLTAPLALLSCLVTVVGAAAAPSSRPAGPGGSARPAGRGGSVGPAVPSWDSYRLIVSRNIFARDRYTPRRPVMTFGPPPAPRGPDYRITLTGVITQGDQRVAFFEDSRTRETIRVPLGGAVASGRLVSVTLDGVEYRSGTTTRKILIGENLVGPAGPSGASAGPVGAPTGPVGGAAGPAYVSAASSAPATAAASGPASRPGEPADKGVSDMLERMRQRRLQELKQ